ncbi:MAG: hypothetical protein ACO3A2_04260 [Bdellovibrionia bacterium]
MADSQAFPAQALAQLIRTTLKKCRPGSTFTEVYQVSSSNKTTAQALAQILKSNPLYSESILAMEIIGPKVARWEEEEKENPKKNDILIDRVVQLLNKTGIRNSVAAIQLNRIRGQGLPRKKNDRFILDPKEQLRYALLAEEKCIDQDLPGSDQSFLAGYHYDLLSNLYVARKAPKELLEMLDKSWAEGEKNAQVALEVASLLKSFYYTHFIVAACLLAPIGKVLMAEMFPKDLGEGSWGSFTKLCQKQERFTYLAQWIGEYRRFSITYADLSALFMSFARLLPSIELAVAFHNDPEFIRARHPDIYKLSCLLCLSSALGSIPEDQDPMERLTAIHIKCMKDLGITESSLKKLGKTKEKKSNEDPKKT